MVRVELRGSTVKLSLYADRLIRTPQTGDEIVTFEAGFRVADHPHNLRRNVLLICGGLHARLYERLRFAPQEESPDFDPEAMPKLDSEDWPEERLRKALRNYAMQYVRNILPEMVKLFGPMRRII